MFQGHVLIVRQYRYDTLLIVIINVQDVYILYNNLERRYACQMSIL